MFFLIKLLLLPVWLPFKLLWEIVEHSSRRSHHRRRRTPARSGYHATGSVTLADRSIAHFRCEHAHRTQTAALECATACQRKIQRGEGNHLITRVQESEAARQRRLALEAERERQRQAERQARAAETAAQKQARAEAKAARQQARAEAKAACQQARAQKQAAQQQARAAREVGPPPAPWPGGEPQYPYRPADPPAVTSQAGPASHRRQARQGLGWPVWGLIGAMLVLVLGVIVAALGGGSQHSPAITAGALLWVVAFTAIAVCVPAALWQWVARRRAAVRPPGI